jgi:ribonuclease kappa
MGSTKDPEDGQAVANACYVAALIYLAFIAFCSCQLGVHRRYSRIQLN